MGQMAEVLVKFVVPVRGGDGEVYWAQACGRRADNGLWEGWLEFATDDGCCLRTSRESEQPNRDDLVYWAEGLTTAYMEGALERARRLEEEPRQPRSVVAAAPHFAGPATDRVVNVRPSAEPSAVLNPFAVYREGEDTLRGQLGALSRDQLVNIARAYGMADGTPRSVIETGSTTDIAQHIVSAVKRQVTSPGARSAESRPRA
jgi:hypothetical protein